MLEMEYKGANSVLITTKNKQLLIDPNVELVGLKLGKYKDVVELATERRFLTDNDDVLQLEGPGEYEVGPFAIRGASAQRHIDTEADVKASTLYHVEVEDFRIGVVGNVDKTLTEEQLETIGIVDILVIPVGGGGYTLDGKDAAAMVAKIEPKIVVPVHYKDSAIKYEVPQEDSEPFVTTLGAPVERESKLKLKSPSALPATLTVYLLSRS